MQNDGCFWTAFSEAETTKLTQIKRLIESLDGAQIFHEAVSKNKITPEMMNRLKIGVDLDLSK